MNFLITYIPQNMLGTEYENWSKKLTL